MTVDAARHLGLGAELGTLEPAKQADLTILDGDPYGCDPDAVMAIPVSETWVAPGRRNSADGARIASPRPQTQYGPAGFPADPYSRSDAAYSGRTPVAWGPLAP